MRSVSASATNLTTPSTSSFAKRAAVGAERKFADPHLEPFLFREIFRHADTGQFRIGVNDAGNDIVVHVPGFARDQFDAGDAFLLGFVRQHRAGDDVADRVNAGDIGAEHLVHFDPAALVERDADFVRADAFGKGTATDRDEDFVGFEVEFFTTFGGGGDGAAVR